MSLQLISLLSSWFMHLLFSGSKKAVVLYSAAAAITKSLDALVWPLPIRGGADKKRARLYRQKKVNSSATSTFYYIAFSHNDVVAPFSTTHTSIHFFFKRARVHGMKIEESYIVPRPLFVRILGNFVPPRYCFGSWQRQFNSVYLYAACFRKMEDDDLLAEIIEPIWMRDGEGNFAR